MILQFINLKLNNFNSYETAELALQDKGFCIVSGKNNYKKDTALSNGSGKSTLGSAICYVLTGETISGIKNNLKNINTDAKDCSVTLEFKVDSDLYSITRISDPKSDLKIVKNGADISGKGIRESEKILADLFPDLTKNLIASTVILGQGMPNKLSSFSPSGRKELLEKLTNSDFMIEDVKGRISKRQIILSEQLRTYEDSLLVNNTQLKSDQNLLEKQNLDLAAANSIDFGTIIPELEQRIVSITEDINKANKVILELDNINDNKNNLIIASTAKKAEEKSAELEAYMSKYNEQTQLKLIKQNEASNLISEIKRLKSVKDICPTCGQKIPGVFISDTTSQENLVKEINLEIENLDKTISEINKKHASYLANIDSDYKYLIDLQNEVKENKKQVQKIKDDIADYTQCLNVTNTELTKYKYEKQNNDIIINRLQYNINELTKKITTATSTIKVTEQAKLVVEEHMAVVKKIETLVKRDFRGYLLYNIIAYLNNKAKEYSKIVFGTDELEIYLNGNTLDISYCNKLYENLSGGEKQRVDLITQFAIRELLQNYFNYSSNILMLDEITDNLDKIATEKIFDLISNKLKNIESVFIISHHLDELGSIPIDSEIQIIKNENGISEIIS